MESYIRHIDAALPRLLAWFNTDPLSPVCGSGDRYWWAWKLIDFPNGTFQSAVWGLSLLSRHPTLFTLKLDPIRLQKRIEQIFEFTGQLARRDGSLAEAFPGEGSYCVTALAVHDHLAALEVLGTDIDPEWHRSCIEAIRPLSDYLVRADEQHAMISNHLATAAAALYAWHRATGDDRAEAKADLLLERILSHQSPEGWFSEYGGPDPGYETLGLTYLARIHELRGDADLLGAVRRSVGFLRHFVHPDGSIGGIYGNRKTRFYFPAGIEYFSRLQAPAELREDAAAIADWMRTSIQNQRTATLSAIDAPNFVPMFNAYVWAAMLAGPRELEPTTASWPGLPDDGKRLYFAHANIVCARNRDCYTVVSAARGGATKWSMVGPDALCRENAGIVARRGNQVATSQYGLGVLRWIDENTLEVEAPLRPLRHSSFTPARMIVIRILSLTVFRSYAVRELVKKLLVRLLILPPAAIRGVHALRRIEFVASGPPKITDRLEGPAANGWELIDCDDRAPFFAGHMASQGYWQIQDDLRDGEDAS